MDNYIKKCLQDIEKNYHNSNKESYLAEFEDYYQHILENKAIMCHILSLPPTEQENFIITNIRYNYQQILSDDIKNINIGLLCCEIVNNIQENFNSVNEEINILNEPTTEYDPLGESTINERKVLMIEYYIKPFWNKNKHLLSFLKKQSPEQYEEIKIFFEFNQCQEILNYLEN